MKKSLYLAFSLWCYSPLCSAHFAVTTTTDSGPGSLRAAMLSLGSAGGTVTFAPGLTGQTITLLSPLPRIASNVAINPAATGPFVTIDGANSHPIFFAQSGNIQLGNFQLKNGAAVGGPGGSNDFSVVFGGGGGGGMGAGGALFVNTAASVTATNVTFASNIARGGTGGNGGNPSSVPIYYSSGGGGGGGMNFGAMAAGGGGAPGGGSLPVVTCGGGGGGGGSGPGMTGLPGNSASSVISSLGGAGGVGGGPFAGGGGAGADGSVASIGSGSPGGNATGLFSGGGGGGGGVLIPPSDGTLGGQGGDFGGGGGAGGGIDSGGQGGVGGYGAGGGGASDVGAQPPISPSSKGGAGGYGAGAGGGGGVGGALPGYGGGISGTGGVGLAGGGGGGAGLGGAVYVRQGGALNLQYSLSSSSLFLTDSCIGGLGGNGASGGAAYGEDLFLASGGHLVLTINAPVTLASSLASDPLNLGTTFVVQGSSILTFSQANTYRATTQIVSSGHLQVSNDNQLGASSFGISLDNGTLGIAPSASFSTQRSIVLQSGGGTIFSGSGSTAVLSGPIIGASSLTCSGFGTITLSGNNTGFSGTTTISSGTTVAVTRLNALPTGTVVDNGVLQLEGLSASVANPISGSGQVQLSGGTVTFNGTKSYTGGTTILSSATLIIPDLISFPSVGAVINDGVLKLQNLTGSLAHSISGSGSVQVNGGALTFTGINTYTGGTQIAKETTLTIGSAAGIPSSGTIINQGSLIFTHGSGVASPGVITGSGSVFMEGLGTLDLDSNNSYGGNTRILSGSVQIHGGSGIGSGSVQLGYDASSAQLMLAQTSGSQTFFRPLILVGSGAKISTLGQWSWTSNITSSTNAPLNVEGPGTLTFSGVNHSLGTVTIASGNVVLSNGSMDGAVVVNNGATLQGKGSVGALTNSGVVHPSSLITVNGNYTQTAQGTLEIGVSGSGAHDLLHTTGIATVDGTLVVTAAPGGYAIGQTYTILTADTKTGAEGLFGTFSQVILPFRGGFDVTYYRDPMIVLTVNDQVILEGLDVSHHNPQQVLHNLEAINHNPGSELILAITEMGTLSSEQLTNALDQMHPALFGAFDLATMNKNAMVTSIFSRRQAELCCDHLGSGCTLPPGSFWVHPFGIFYDQKRVGEQVGFDDHTAGLVAGIDYCLDNGLLLGVGGGYSTSFLKWHERRGSGHQQSSFLGLYADYAHQLLHWDASLVGSMDRFEATRVLNFATIHRRAKHTANGYDLTAHLGIGRDVPMARFFLQPFLQFDYLYLHQNGFTESGASALNLSVQAHGSHLLRSEVGLSLTRSFALSDQGCFSPTLFASAINECFLVKEHYESHFVHQTPSFAVRTWNKPLYLFSPGIDLSFVFGPSFTWSVRYAPEIGSGVTAHKIDSRFQYVF